MDYYLEDRARLEGQPKRAIADYVEQNGVLVPRRFDSLRAAKNSGLDFIARSEHPQDYDGASNVFPSPVSKFKLLSEVTSEEDLINRILKDDSDNINCDDLSKLLGVSKDEFTSQLSFSFWEYLDGYNRFIVADDVIKGKYHVGTYRGAKGDSLISYSVVDANGSTDFNMPLNQELRDGLPSLIDSYERVRFLSRFNSNHCPIMEFQTIGDKHYFLQYHRSRDFSKSDFVIEGDVPVGFVEVPFVRGATGKEVKKSIFIFRYASATPSNQDIEQGSSDDHFYPMFSELAVRKREVQILRADEDGFEYVLFLVTNGHRQRSQLFKPRVSIIANFKDIFTQDAYSRYIGEKSSRGRFVVNLEYISDGGRCFVKKIE